MYILKLFGDTTVSCHEYFYINGAKKKNWQQNENYNFKYPHQETHLTAIKTEVAF
jgi:hypothetical protein